ncbi:uncharacterized protein LOC142469805 isoform X5 [Ascaphus truei]|uniref:uncharacterized protein LOC142469805 isoform X5 n=1 Tax=Ascaphus truei TaxID=8439 RepID=UPI003F5A7BD9
MSLPLSPCPLPPSNYLTPCTYPPQSLPPYPALLPTPLFPNLLLTLCLLQLLVTTLRVMGGGMSQVLDGLYLGNIRDAEDKATLSRNGIAHIVSVHNNAKPLLPEVTYLCIAASDSANQNLLDKVPAQESLQPTIWWLRHIELSSATSKAVSLLPIDSLLEGKVCGVQVFWVRMEWPLSTSLLEASDQQ